MEEALGRWCIPKEDRGDPYLVDPLLHRTSEARAQIGDKETVLTAKDGIFWMGFVDTSALQDGACELQVTANDEDGMHKKSSIQLRVGEYPERSFAATDHENSIGGWAKRCLPGIQLGLHRNGKKWSVCLHRCSPFLS